MNEIENYNQIVKILALTKFSQLSSRLLDSLISHFGNLERIINADAGSLMAINGMTAEIANKITKAASYLPKAQQYQNTLSQQNISIISRFDADYPSRLFELNNPPSILYLRGKLPDNNKKIVALVGTKQATNEGIELTTKAAKEFSQAKVQIISSLNSGIGAAAHLGGKNTNSVSFSVLNSGFEKIYPDENQPLANDIVIHGGLLSEYPPEAEFEKKNYKSSNRIIAGLAQAVVITEFYKDSIQTLDLLSCCSQIGKLSFILIDPKWGALTDKESMNLAVSYGALPMVGLNKIDDIINSLV
ncbi:MAG: hypothetical protein GXO93_03085 [FCB group bacterium]|nr:hypothetical protein [FCB group bacterium]